MTDMSQSEYLRHRYGGHGADNRNLWIVAGLLIAVVVAWLVWQAIALRQPSVAAEGVALDVVSSSEVTVTFNVTTTPGATVTCTVRAMTENLTEVGIKEVTVGPVTEALTTVSTTVATIQPATGASVGDCLIVDS